MNMLYHPNDCPGMVAMLSREIAKPDGAISGLMKANVMEILTNSKNAVLFRLKAVVGMARVTAKENRHPAARLHMLGVARKNASDKQLQGMKAMCPPSNHTDPYKWIPKHA
jgi:hypothetical protein